MNLKENLNIWFVVMDSLIPSIDETANGRLRHCSNSLIVDRAFNSIEEVDSVAENIFNIAIRSKASAEVILPEFDFWEFGIIPFLDSIDFSGHKADSGRKSRWLKMLVFAIIRGSVPNY